MRAGWRSEAHAGEVREVLRAAGSRPDGTAAGRTLLLLGLFFGALAPRGLASEPPPARPASATGTAVIPDRFLRRWDPLTIFFVRDAGPPTPGPEDRPERLVTLTPSHPGAWRWIDGRTLQFRPAEPWPALSRFTVKAEEKTATLATLLSAPVETIPTDKADGLEPLSEITLAFPEPLETEALSRMVSLELRPLPGVGAEGGRQLTRDEFEVKPLERRARFEPSRYALVLRQPVALGTKVVVRLRLSLDDKDAESFKELAFSTAEPFRVTAFGCRDRQVPATPRGARYAKDQALTCTGQRSVVVEFSATPSALGPVEGRDLVRLSPAVANLSFNLQGRTLEVAGDFAFETLYNLSLAPAPVRDQRGRTLEMSGRSEVFLQFPRRPAYVRLTQGQGMAERFGPQMVPVDGRGQERLDLRIHRVLALDRSLWPFPDRPVSIDESARPPGPGEEPKAHDDPGRNLTVQELQRHLTTLGSPPVSALVTLPLKREGSAASFGLDLEPHLAAAFGKGVAGTYLVGVRDVASAGERQWMRLQVTDLALSTLEEPMAVRFAVTSLSTGLPVGGAGVRVEATLRSQETSWVTLAEGTTGPDGTFRWAAPGHDPRRLFTVRRIVVEKESDRVVFDATRPPERYADNQWSKERATWLQWTVEPLQGRGTPPQVLAHLFTERPVYRPEEEVHVKGYLRTRAEGRLQPVSGEGWLVVQGPGDLAWRYPVTLTTAGSFYHKFQEKDLPTGTFTAHFEDKEKKNRYGSVAFQVEAYRIPQFEVLLHGPEKASLDQPFEVSLTASYYAGGRVGGQPVHWRVTQFPYSFAPRKREGFLYSSDARFSASGRFQSTPRLDRDDVTAPDGSAKIALDPTIEATAEPRTYVVEATVTGADDQTVTATRTLPAVPPFLLGLKVPRYLERASFILGQMLVAGPDGDLVAGREVTLRLLRREWHSHLRQSDFTDGVARYITDTVDVKVSESKLTSGATPLPLKLPIEKAGVYVVELESHDRLGRAQVVSVDLYAGGDQPVAWPKPVTPVFSVALDQPRYDPGATAGLVLKSPFQTGQVLCVVEAPEGNRYSWLGIANGSATFRLPVEGHFAPRIPVHFILMRGRLPNTGPLPGNNTDLGKPATLAATAWLDVNPVANQVAASLEHVASTRPGQKIDVTIRLKDPKGAPLPGEVTLWLVDAAVLALGREQRLDPLPDFLPRVDSHLDVHDTRNLAFGALPFALNPGGDGALKEAGLLDRATVRKNFKSVPYFNPQIAVGPDGVARVTVQLPDDLTTFKLRAKVASGPERFGHATSQLAVRLPVIVQPALPRFVRPGDRFTAAALGRVVEGEGGPGAAEVRAEGVDLQGPTRRELTLVANKPERIEVPVTVKTPPRDAEGRLSWTEVLFRMGIERTADGAADAFESRLPLREDRERVTKRVLEELKPGVPLKLPEVTEGARPGTLRRQILLSNQPALVKMAAGLDFFREYPYGCTEQQMSRARAYVAFRKFRALLGQKGGEKDVDRAVRDTLAFVPTAVDPSGLVAYWPGSRGYVSLTAWTVQFLLETKAAGYPVDEKLLARLLRSLEQALRSDYSRFIDGESFAERAWALVALHQAGQANPAYAAELARKTQFLDLEGVAQVLTAFDTSAGAASTIADLSRALGEGLVTRLFQGKEVYGGLQERRPSRNGLILPDETRTVAEVARAFAKCCPQNKKLPLLTQALVTLGRDDGWGSTNANASALLALSELLEPKAAGGPTVRVTVKLDGKEQTVTLGASSPVVLLSGATTAAAEVLLPAGATGTVLVRAETGYVPTPDGSQAPARGNGFVVTRELLRLTGEDTPSEKLALAEPGRTLSFAVGQVVEEHVQVVNPKARNYVAVVVPLAAGLEVLNPRLATSPPEAKAKGSLTMEPTYAAFLDDQVAFYYDTLPAGTYDFYFRTRAQTEGSFTQPGAKAEMMYDAAVSGSSVGARITVTR